MAISRHSTSSPSAEICSHGINKVLALLSWIIWQYRLESPALELDFGAQEYPAPAKSTAAAALVEKLHTKVPSSDTKVAAVLCDYKKNDAVSVTNILAGI